MVEEYRRVQAVIYRGGTSRGVFLRENDLPLDPAARRATILRIFGSPDPRQIDGLGGADPLTSKVAIIGPPSRPDADVDYTFGQVSIDSQLVDYKGNCGNISSAVGPYAIEEGLVRPTDPLTRVRIHNTNTGVIIAADIETRDGRPVTHGDCTIGGVPGSGSPILLDFLHPEGAVTGHLLPTGSPMDQVEVRGNTFTVSVVDATTPVVMVRASELGLRGNEEARELARNTSLLETLEEIRSHFAETLGIVSAKADATALSPAVPKVAIVGAVMRGDGTTTSESQEPHFYARLMSMQMPHKAVAMTGGICLACAACMPGTVVNELTNLGPGEQKVRVGHPSGVAEFHIKVDDFTVQRAAIVRTARRLMDGYAYIPAST